MTYFVYLFIFLFIGQSVWAQEFGARILQISQSKNSLIVDKGSLEGIKVGDFALIIKEIRKNIDNVNFRTELHPLLKLRSVKVNGRRSIWIVLEHLEDELLKLDDSIYLLTESELLRGRKKLTIDRTTLISDKESVSAFTKRELKRDEAHLSVKKDNYSKGRKLKETKPTYANDINLIDVDIWENKNADLVNQTTSIFRSSSAKDFSIKKRIATFEKMSAHFIEKFSDPSYRREKFFEEQEKDHDLGIFSQNGSVLDYRGETLYRERRNKEEQKKLVDKFIKEGPAWSDDYSDEELGELITKAGMSAELIRQEESTYSEYKYQLSFSFGMNLLDNQNAKDPDNHQDNTYDLSFGFEYFAFKKYENFLNRLSLEGNLRSSKDGFKTSYFNALTEDKTLSFFLNYYPFAKPTDLRTNIFYVGVGFRTGFAFVHIPSVGEEGNYQLSSFPSLNTGLKYAFINGYGLRLNFSYDTINLNRINTNSTKTFNLKDRFTYLEGKTSISLTKLF